MMRNRNRILLTYLDMEAALAAAAFLRKYPDSRLKITSASRIPEALERILRREFKGEIYILGLGFSDREEDIKQVIKKLLKSKIKIIWINSVNDLSTLKTTFPEIDFIENSSSLVENVAIYLNLKDEIKDLIEISADDESPQMIMILSAIYKVINYEDYDIYPSVIRELASGKKFSPSENIKQFKAYFSRKIIGKSEGIKKLRKIIQKIGADNYCKVLITGESGTGKNTVAYLLHYISERKNHPFFTISCANFSESLLESEIFGHEKGAFTGAVRQKRGLIELAGDGTLFLDEIGEMPLSVQAKFLRFIQEGRFFRVGGEKEIECHPRIIAATNKNLLEMVKEGKFREDLYYRLTETMIHIPPLRERKQDIEFIGNNILYNICTQRGKPARKLRKKEVEQLKKYHWPGNIRELENVLTQAYILDDWDFDFIYEDRVINEKKEDFEVKPLREMENEYILKVYNFLGRNKQNTAGELKIAINTLRSRLKELGVD